MSPIEILSCLLVYSLTACLVWQMEKISWIRALVKCTVLGAAFYIFYTVAHLHEQVRATLMGATVLPLGILWVMTILITVIRRVSRNAS